MEESRKGAADWGTLCLQLFYLAKTGSCQKNTKKEKAIERSAHPLGPRNLFCFLSGRKGNVRFIISQVNMLSLATSGDNLAPSLYQKSEQMLPILTLFHIYEMKRTNVHFRLYSLHSNKYTGRLLSSLKRDRGTDTEWPVTFLWQMKHSMGITGG